MLESQRDESEKKRSGMFENFDVEALEEVKREFTAREQRLRESGFKTQAKLNTLRNLVNDTDSNDENVEPTWAVGRQTDSDPNLATLEVR